MPGTSSPLIGGSRFASSVVAQAEIALIDKKAMLLLVARLLAPHPTPEDETWQRPKNG